MLWSIFQNDIAAFFIKYVESLFMTRKFLIVASFADSLVKFRGDLIDSLLSKGLRVHVAAPDLADHDSVRLALEKRGCVVHQIKMDRTGLNPFLDLISFFSLLFIIKKVRPYYILAYTIKPVVYGLLASSVVGVPKKFALITGLGYSFSDSDPATAGRLHRLVGKISRFLYKSALRFSDTTFFQNPDDQCLFYKLNLLDKNACSFVVNGSGVDVHAFHPHPLPETPHFLLIARLLYDKGVCEYVEAAKSIRAKHPSARFSLAGWIDGGPNSISQAELSEWQSSGVINYLGRLDDVRQAIGDSSVYVLPSYREGTPRTVLEAMAMGRPIVTTDAPGCRETVISGENGFLVKVRSVKELEKAMTRLIEDPALIKKMGVKSRSIALEKYDVNAVNASMLLAMGII